MRALLQRVRHASVVVAGETVGAITHGFLVLVGIGQGDSDGEVQQLVNKIVHLRVFEDEAGKMNRSLLESGGQALVVSQFTLYADVRKGRRPSFISAASPTLAEPLIERFKAALGAHGIHVEGGVFGAHMQVTLLNDGPVTIWLDSEDLAR